jgi:hypothetical protein
MFDVGDGDDGDVVVVSVVVDCDVLAVVKHFVLKLFPIHTTITFELPFVDCTDCVLSVLCGMLRKVNGRRFINRIIFGHG